MYTGVFEIKKYTVVLWNINVHSRLCDIKVHMSLWNIECAQESLKYERTQESSEI